MRSIEPTQRATGAVASVALTMAILVLPSAPAGASEPSSEPDAPAVETEASQEASAAQLSAEGTAAFEAGELERALVLFHRAHELEPKPNLVFNIGRVHEELGQLEEAAEHYSEFLTQPGVDLETRQFAADRLAVIRKILAQAQADREAAEQKAAEEAEPAPAPPPAPVVVAPPPTPAPVPEQPPADPRPPKLRIAGAVLTGTGGLALIAGAALAGVSSSRVSAANGEELVDDQNRLLNQARPLALGADVLFITGGVVAVTGVTMLAVSYAKRNKQRSAWVPMFDGRNAALGFMHRF